MSGLEKAIPCPNGWVTNVLEKNIQSSMAAVISAASHKFDRRGGCFDLFGFDFMIGDDFKLHLIEVNTNPALHISDGQVLEELLPKVVTGTLDIVLEAHGKEKSHESATNARNEFHLIFNEKEQFRFSTNEQKLLKLEKMNALQERKLNDIEHRMMMK